MKNIAEGWQGEMSVETKAKVKAAARSLAAALTDRGLARQIKIEVGEPWDEPWTEGSAIVVATLGFGRPEVAVWFDKTLDGAEQGYWAGFGHQQRKVVEQIVSDCFPMMKPSRVFERNDFEQRENIICLSNRPDDTELQFPIQEHNGQYNGFGIYGRPSEPFDVGKATIFIESVISVLPEYSSSEDYKAFERKVVCWHLRSERNPRLAQQCKKRDQFRCKVCDFRFVEKYGPLGEEFAEAHHIVPLSTLRGEIETSVDDLATVCANCHRMLHRMDGKPDDIDNLRKMLK